MFLRPPARRLATASLAVASCLALAACSASGNATGGASGGLTGSSQGGGSGVSQTGGEAVPAPTMTLNVQRGARNVPVSTLVSVDADGGALNAVTVSSKAGEVRGTMSADGATWTATERLEPATTYTVRAAAGSGEATARRTSSFTTQDLTLAEQTYPSVAPLQGETVGVGMPVIVTFDVPVTDHAEFERNMTVTSTPRQVGTWHWLSDTEVHYRPKTYWKAGTRVSVDVDVNGVDAGNGIYGQEDRVVDFKVGDAHIYKVDSDTHQMKVLSNGKLLRTIPITLGKSGFTTRSGTKVIVEKFESKTMNSETVGIPSGSAESYNIDNVQWAMRLTYSGEFIHAAPWSVGSQGNANVSHGCTGMSTENAAWLYAMSRRGDVVETVNTGRPMTLDNGYGDWNESFREYAKGSAL